MSPTESSATAETVHDHRNGLSARLRSAPREVAGAALWAFVVQYFVMLLAVQTAWREPYSIVAHTISDLGAVDCGVFEGRSVCSPWHAAANTSWVVAGASIALGGALLWRTLARSAASRVGMALLVLAGLAELAVGLNPEDASSWHIPAAAVAIISGLAGITTLGASLSRIPAVRRLGHTGIGLGALGIASLLTAFLIAPERLFGLFERLAVYPILVWVILAGSSVLAGVHTQRSQEDRR